MQAEGSLPCSKKSTNDTRHQTDTHGPCHPMLLKPVAAEMSVIITIPPVSLAHHIPQLKQTAVKTFKFTQPTNQATTTISSGKCMTRIALKSNNGFSRDPLKGYAIKLSAILFQSDTC
jgi:hypothetical protein